MASAVVCILCKGVEGEMNSVGWKGLKSMLQSCRDKKEEYLHEELSKADPSEGAIYVHNSATFDWKVNCFICGKRVDTRHETKRIHQVLTLPIYNRTLQCAKERRDDWGQEVQARLESCSDLVAVEAIYHSNCMVTFKTQKIERQKVKGRPPDSHMTVSFEKLCDWLEMEAESEIYSVQELHERMLELSDGKVYSMKAFREKLKVKYENHIYFVKSAGCRGELVCFREMTKYSFRDLKDKGLHNRENVVKAAAKIIKEEIREMCFNKNVFPSTDDIISTDNETWVPSGLRIFMELLVPTKIKQRSLSQCIVQAARPRSVIAPIPFGVGVGIDKSTGSKQMITHLARLGFSITPEEVARFKQSAIEQSTEPSSAENHDSPSFRQWVGDNVDHNIATLTGKGTFHGMGIIRIDSEPIGNFGNIPRLKERRPSGQLTKNRGVEIVPYKQKSRVGLQNVVFEPIPTIPSSYHSSEMLHYDLLWHSAWYLSSYDFPRPNWSGFLQCATYEAKDSNKSSIEFLPIIDLSSTNETCIYSTLLFVISQAEKLKVQTPCITFEQPLWIKAFNIVLSEKLSIVCRLGGFHTLMNFIGSIGTLMRGSGTEDLLSEVYAENSVNQMLSGKAIARAIRAHILVESSLMSLLLEQLKETDIIEFEDLRIYYDKVLYPV